MRIALPGPEALMVREPIAHRPSLAVTILNRLESKPGTGFGIGVQIVPSQCIISADPSYLPTAQISLGPTAAIPSRCVSLPGSGVGTSAQCCPSQCPMRALIGL